MLPKRWQSQRGFTLIEMIVVVAVLGILVAIVVPALLSAADRSRQRRSMADMTNLAKANGMYQIDVGGFAAALSDLQPDYLQVVPANDAWGTPFQYAAGPNQLTYQLSSLGSDAAAGPGAPAVWFNEPYEPDIVMATGTFTQMPVSQ